MGVAVDAEHVELGQTVRSFLSRNEATFAARKVLDGSDPLPPFWNQVGELGWLGLHLPEKYGGSGYDLLALAIVAEEFGRQCSPGPLLPTTVASAVIAACGSDELKAEVLPDLARGTTVAGVALGDELTCAHDRVDGERQPVAWGQAADIFVLAVGADLVVADRDAAGLQLVTRESVDPASPLAEVSCEGLEIRSRRLLVGARPVAEHILYLLAAAEAAGGAAACVEMATKYALSRSAFGRPIGQYQAVKHHCANMHVRAEAAAAAVWAAAGCDPGLDEGAAAMTSAAVLATSGFVSCATVNIQVHGGVGYTWEHDAQLFLRRAVTLRACIGPIDTRCAELSRSLPDPTDEHSVHLPSEANPLRLELRSFVEKYWTTPESERHRLLVSSGLIYPEWPEPWGRNAEPLEKLIIDEELRAIPRTAAYGPSYWSVPIIVPTILQHGSPDQVERWVEPTIGASLKWCQLFSEPGAGSDLAGVTTRAEPVAGGWELHGQKVWTSTAHDAKYGLALVRTDRSVAKHRGLTCMVVDMHAPTVEVRPLKEITGSTSFSEVFLDGVFVPDTDVLGEVSNGWEVAKTTLSNERASLADRAWIDMDSWSHLATLVEQACARRPGLPSAFGRLIAEARAVRSLGSQLTQRALVGQVSGFEGNLLKLVAGEHAQRVTDFALEVLGSRAAFADGAERRWIHLYLYTQRATIAGGTSEILRNAIAERGLGLLRDPQPSLSDAKDGAR